MKRHTFLLITLMTFLAILPVFSWGDSVISPVGPGNVQFITITGTQQGNTLVTKIEPFNKVFLDRFTKVIFTNESSTPMRLTFGKGQKCQTVSEATIRNLSSMEFSFGCWTVAQSVPPGQTLEIAFNEAGHFPYQADFVGSEAKQSGLIVVY